MTHTMPEKQSGNDLGAANSPSGSPDTRTAPKPPQIASAAALCGFPGTWTGPDNDDEEDDQ